MAPASFLEVFERAAGDPRNRWQQKFVMAGPARSLERRAIGVRHLSRESHDGVKSAQPKLFGYVVRRARRAPIMPVTTSIFRDNGRRQQIRLVIIELREKIAPIAGKIDVILHYPDERRSQGQRAGNEYGIEVSA